jgi:hypothetical protein
MTNTTRPAQAVADALRDLLAAIYEAVVPPLAADYADNREFERLQGDRALLIQGAVKYALNLDGTALGDIVQATEAATAYMRSQLTAPLPYRAADDAENTTTEVAA